MGKPLPGDWKRLSIYVVARRAKLGMKSQADLARVAGLSPRTIGEIEQGHSVRGSSLAGLDEGLQWKLGSSQAVLNGQEASPSELTAPEDDAATDAELRARQVAGDGRPPTDPWVTAMAAEPAAESFVRHVLPQKMDGVAYGLSLLHHDVRAIRETLDKHGEMLAEILRRLPAPPGE